MNCHDCKREVDGLYDRVTDGASVCFDCLERTAPEQVSEYPGWRERMALRSKRAVVARQNFQGAAKG